MNILDPPVPGAVRRHLRWRHLHGSATALALAEATRSDQKLYVVVVDAARELARLTAELAFFAGERLVPLTFPDWEVLPYDLFSPHPDIISRRLRTLYELPQLKHGCLIVAADTLMQRLPPRQYVQARSFVLTRGQTLTLEPFRQRLAEAGYASVSQVRSPGEFAVRGSLFDVFPMGSEQPLRIDLFDEQIEAIRRFDPDSQRSLETIESLQLLPARELPLDPQAVREFRRRFRTRFEGEPMRSAVYRGVSEGLAPAGVEFYLPLFFEQTSTLLDYLPANAVIVREAALPEALERAWKDIETRYEERRHDLERPVLAPAELFIDPATLGAQIERFASVTLDTEPAAGPAEAAAVRVFPALAPQELRVDMRTERPLEALERFLGTFGGRVLIAADSPGRREVLQELLRNHPLAPIGAARDGTHESEAESRPHGLAVEVVAGWEEFLAGSSSLNLCVAADLTGLWLTEPPLAVIAEAQLFGARARQERRRKRAAADPEAILRDLQDLNPGAPVVHEEYGVGRYVGLQPMEVAGQAGEFLVLEYQGGDRVYVPVHALHLVTRYTGTAPESAPLHKLGTDQWAKARRRAAEQIRDVAAELLDLYARRKAQAGLKLTLNEAECRTFAEAFPFEETEDQREAIRQVLADLGSHRPMDRIV